MTPTERLLAAADLLDKRAGEASEGPWNIIDELYMPVEDARYIATVHPEVGKAQATWLRESAADLLDTPGTWTQHTLCARFIGHPDEANRCRHYDPALRLADLILGGAS